MFRLGAFELQARLGQGGMGEVWRGLHRSQHTPVAVKLLTGNLARQHAFRAAFRNEVRAVAGLDHPHIIQVLDYGTVQAEGPGLPWKVGTPWLAMELAEDGSLDGASSGRSWASLLAILWALLDALAHAHARGVIHRDIKPANLLLSSGGVLKLTDFGLAHALDHTADFLAGTPAFMAPEQFEGRWRDYGPWTDLYAVGCVVWALCTGRPPHGNVQDWAQGHARHTSAPLPKFTPEFPVPEGLESWVRRALSKDPRRRWRRCADASLALTRLGGAPDGGAVSIPVLGSTVGRGTTVAATLVPLALTDPLAPAAPAERPPHPPPRPTVATPMSDSAADPGVPPAIVPLREGEVPAPPSTWRRPEPAHRAARIIGAGLGLFGLRTIPMVGRRAERDLLWSALLQVCDAGRPALVLVEGEEGCGRSRLLGWLAERAHETGAATSVAGSFGGMEDRVGVPAMLHRVLRTSGLESGPLLERVAATLISAGENDPKRWEEAADALRDMPESGLRGGRERAAVRARVIASLAAERPVVVTLDDAHLDPEAIDLARELLGVDAPVLVVCSLLPVAPGSRQAARLAALRADPRARMLHLGPLQEAHRSELVRQILGLEPELAHEVERRSGGDPAYVVHLVGDWVQRGLLEPGRRGFRLKDGARVGPAMDATWTDRLSSVLEDLPPEATRALELVAVMGGQVGPEEWRRIILQTGLRSGGDLVERLLARQIARCGAAGPQAGWRLAHGSLRDALESGAVAGGRLSALHEEAAAILEPLGGPGVAERRGRHLAGAGRFAEAIDPLRVAIDERLARGDLGQVNVLLAERERAIDPGEGSPIARAEGWVRWGRLAEGLGRLADGQAWAERAVEVARGKSSVTLVDALVLLGRVARLRGEWSLAWRYLAEAGHTAEADSSGWRPGLVHLERGRWHYARSNLERAVEAYQAARQDLERAGDGRNVGEALLELARVATARARWGAASVLVDWAHARLTQVGNRGAVARCSLLASRIARERSEDALDLADDALDELRAVGGADVWEGELELAQVLFRRRDLVGARALVDSALRGWTTHGFRPAATRAHALALCIAGRSRDLRALERHAGRMEGALGALGVMDPELRGLVDEAAREVEEADGSIARNLRARLDRSVALVA